MAPSPHSASEADHPAFAAFFDAVSKAADRAGFSERRRRLLAGARGRVLDVGAGTGLNIPHYVDDQVERVVMLEPDGAMRRRLLDRLAEANVDVEVHEASIERADFGEASFDTAVCSLVLCSVPDQAGALTHIRRWLHPERGRLLFLEHVRTPGWRAPLQRAASPLWSRLASGCRFDRNTLDSIRKAGFVITDCDRFRMPGTDVVQGTARPAWVTA